MLKTIECNDSFIFKWKIVAKRTGQGEPIFYYVYRKYWFFWIEKDFFLYPDSCLKYIKSYEENYEKPQLSQREINEEIWKSK